MWSEEQGLGTAQEQFDAVYSLPATDPFWRVVIGDPGPELLFDNAVYLRGAMAVHALRLEVGDRDFFPILHAWTTRRAGGNGTIPQFIRLAERISGEQLDDLFRVWLFTGGKPVLEPAAAATATAASPSAAAALEQARGAQRLRR
jgi:aminopeptidase N